MRIIPISGEKGEDLLWDDAQKAFGSGFRRTSNITTIASSSSKSVD